MAGTSGSRRVVIVGGGFAGLFAARALRRPPVRVTLIDRAEHHLFQPLAGQIREVATKVLAREYRHIQPGDARVLLFDGGTVPLAMYAGRKITQEAQGHAYDKPFRYRDLGSAAYISRGRAVVSAFGLHFGGFLGWVAWLFIHIGFLTGFRNRVGAIVSWWFAFARDLRRERTFTVDDTPVPSGAYGDTGEPGHPADTAHLKHTRT